MIPPGTEIVGPTRRPRNLSADAVGSIHDDSTASALGFRGGTVAGNVHLVQFVPLLLDVLGTSWFETGTLSVYFRRATVDAEPVRAVVGRPPIEAAGAAPSSGLQVPVRMETEDGAVVADGTASVGDAGVPSALAGRDLRPVDPASLDLLRRVEPGAVFPRRRVHLAGDTQNRLVAAGQLSEPLQWYTGPSPWGGPVACPISEVDLLTAVEDDLRELTPPGVVGMYGAIELHHHAGPVFVDRDYDVDGRVLAVSTSPRTEIVWYESTAWDADRPIVTMRMMSRLLPRSAEPPGPR